MADTYEFIKHEQGDRLRVLTTQEPLKREMSLPQIKAEIARKQADLDYLKSLETKYKELEAKQ